MIKRERAIELENCLVDANDALARAGRVIAGFGKEDRMRFGGLLSNVLDALHAELLAAIYAQHPDMEPPQVDDEIPTIDSDLRWHQVQLPSSVTESDFDRVILSELSARWRKTARIVGKVSEHCVSLGIDISPQIVAARLMAMVDADRIEDVGDLRSWRFSEVRLKD